MDIDEDNAVESPMSPADQPTERHQVGVTNAQEKNPDAVIADLTKQMNAYFAAGEFGEAALLALQITARSRDELRDTFVRHGVTVLHLDHEAFGIYEGLIEPTYDVHVEGPNTAVLAAAAEFGKHHAQEMILIARKVKEGEHDPAERLGLTILLDAPINLEEAVEITVLVKDHGLKGATFAPKRRGTVAIYHTDNLGMTPGRVSRRCHRCFGRTKAELPSVEFRRAEVHHSHATTMNTPTSIDKIMSEMNDRAKAEGRYLGKAFWEVPSQTESILDVPSTPEAELRLAALRARRLERRKRATEKSEPVAPPQEVETETHEKIGR